MEKSLVGENLAPMWKKSKEKSFKKKQIKNEKYVRIGQYLQKRAKFALAIKLQKSMCVPLQSALVVPITPTEAQTRHTAEERRRATTPPAPLQLGAIA